MDSTIYINDKKYDYVNSVRYKNRMYVAYMDKRTVYISEYYFDGDDIFFKDISPEDFDEIEKALGL